MTTLVELLRGVNLIAGAVLVGALVMETAILFPLARKLGPDVLRIATPRALKYLPASGVVSSWSALGAAVVALIWTHLSTARAALTFAGFVCTVSGAAVRFMSYLPADRRVRELEPGTPPAVLSAALDRMARRHELTMLLFGMGYGCFVAAVVP